MFDLNSYGNAAKKLNAEYLKSLPTPAVKGVITGGGEATFKDGTKSPFVTVSSPSGQWQGDKEAILNATNRAVLKAAFGAQPLSWIGKEVGFFYDPTVTIGGKVVGGMRVQVPKPDYFASQAPSPAAAPAAIEADIPF